MKNQLDDSFFENPLVKEHEVNILPMLKEITLKRTFIFTSNTSLKVIWVILNGTLRNELESSLNDLLEVLIQDSDEYIENKYSFSLKNDVLLKEQLTQFENDLNSLNVQIEELEIKFDKYFEENNLPIEIKKGFRDLLSEPIKSQ